MNYLTDNTRIVEKFDLITPNEVLEKYPHHLINHVSVEHIFSVANFYDIALQLIRDIHLQVHYLEEATF